MSTKAVTHIHKKPHIEAVTKRKVKLTYAPHLWVTVEHRPSSCPLDDTGDCYALAVHRQTHEPGGNAATRTCQYYSRTLSELLSRPKLSQAICSCHDGEIDISALSGQLEGLLGK